jgi:hypothetical protein
MSGERLLASLSVRELEQLMRHAIGQCLIEPKPTPGVAALLGRVAAEIRFELWLREQPVRPLGSRHRQSLAPAAGARTH